MKAIICLVAVVFIGVTAAYPAQEGEAYTNEAIRQAQNSRLIPPDAQIQNVQEGIRLAAFENIPGNQHVDLQPFLSSLVPEEVVRNLQRQIDSVGHN